jgi:hypothetical protein
VYPDDSTRIELSVSEPEVLLPKNSEMLRIVSIVDFDSDCEKLIIISYGLISLKFPSGMYTGIVPYVGRARFTLAKQGEKSFSISLFIQLWWRIG